MEDDINNENYSDQSETAMSGADATGAITPPLAANAGTIIDIMSRVGSQGAPVPSNALEAQQRATEVSKFLAGELRGLTENQGAYGDIANALASTVAGQGKTSYGQAMQGLQNQRITRAYNIANAIAGLGRIGSPGQLTEYQRLQLEKDKTEGAARDRRDWGTRTDAMIRTAVNNLANPGEGIAFFQKRMQELGATRDSSVADLDRISRQIFAEFPRQGFAAKKERDESEVNEVTGGPMRDADGRLIGWEPWRKTRGRLTADQETQNMVWENSRGQPIEDRLRLIQDVISSKAATAAGVTSAMQRQITGYTGSVAKAKSALAIVDRLSNLLDRPGALTGASGVASIVAEGIRSQADQVSRILSSGVVVKSGETGMTRERIPATAFRDVGQTNALWEQYASPSVRSGVVGLFGNSEIAQQIRTNTLILAFAVAGAAEPGGRISDNDVKRVTEILGANNAFSSPQNMKAALGEVSRWLKGRVEGEYSAIYEGLPESQRDRIRPPNFGTAQPAAAPAGAPTAAPQVPAFDPARINTLLEKYAPR